MSDTGVIPDSFTKRGTNIGIELDGAAMLRDGIPLHLSHANVVLCARPIEAQYITSVKYFVEPRHTLYKRPTSLALASAARTHCTCA